MNTKDNLKDQISIQTAKLEKAQTVKEYYEIMQIIGQLQAKLKAATQKLHKDAILPIVKSNAINFKNFPKNYR